jgi:hypothetical protein
MAAGLAVEKDVFAHSVVLSGEFIREKNTHIQTDTPKVFIKEVAFPVYTNFASLMTGGNRRKTRKQRIRQRRA